jgi:hypothetical protein
MTRLKVVPQTVVSKYDCDRSLKMMRATKRHTQHSKQKGLLMEPFFVA